MDPMLPTQQIGQSRTGWPFEQKRENARSPTERSHLTDTLSPVHQQHHDCASPTCLNTLHADDLAVWSASEYTTSSAYRIQEAVNKVEQWTNDWGLQISEVKTQTTIFPLSTSKEKVAIKLGDKTLPQVETPTFLGVKLYTQLSRKPHIEDMEKKGIKKLAVLKKLSGTHWGANSKILKTVYMGAVRPSLETASLA